MSRCTRLSDSFLKWPREWGWWSQRSGTGVGGRAGERRGNGLPDGFHFSFWPKASPGCSPIGKAGLDWAWVGTHGLRASGGSSGVGAPHPNQEVLGDTGEGAVLDVWAGRVGWTRELDAGAGRGGWTRGLVAGSWPRPSGCHPLQRRSGSALLGLCPFSEQPLAWSSPAPVPSLPPADWDECADGLDHDCSPAAQCINLEGSYTCHCLTARDANPARAGRACAGVSPTRHPSGSGPCSRRGLGGGGGVAFCVLYDGHSVAGPPIQ